LNRFNDPYIHFLIDSKVARNSLALVNQFRESVMIFESIQIDLKRTQN